MIPRYPPNFVAVLHFLCKPDGITDGQTDRRTDDPISRCHRRTFQAGSIKGRLKLDMYLWNTDAYIVRWQQSQTMAKISKSYILTPPHPQGYEMSVKCQQPLDELTIQVWLLYDHPNFKYWTLFISGTELRIEKQTDRRSDDPNTRCPSPDLSGRGHEKTLTFFLPFLCGHERRHQPLGYSKSSSGSFALKCSSAKKGWKLNKPPASMHSFWRKLCTIHMWWH